MGLRIPLKFNYVRYIFDRFVLYKLLYFILSILISLQFNKQKDKRITNRKLIKSDKYNIVFGGQCTSTSMYLRSMLVKKYSRRGDERSWAPVIDLTLMQQWDQLTPYLRHEMTTSIGRVPTTHQFWLLRLNCSKS